MREVALFVEDDAHRQIIGPLVNRIAEEHNATIRLDWRTAVRGHGKVVQELRIYLRDLARQGAPWPDVIIVATDANCDGLNDRVRELDHYSREAHAPVVLAIPDPHVERWLLLDGAAFKAAVGHGCKAPDQKCDRGRYKQRLMEAVCDAGVTPILGGLEYAGDIVQRIDLDRVSRADRSFARFVDGLRAIFRDTRPTGSGER